MAAPTNASLLPDPAQAGAADSPLTAPIPAPAAPALVAASAAGQPLVGTAAVATLRAVPSAAPPLADTAPRTPHRTAPAATPGPGCVGPVLGGGWRLSDSFRHKDINHALVTVTLPSEPNHAGVAYLHMERSVAGFDGHERNTMVLELPAEPPSRGQPCVFDFAGVHAPFSALCFFSWRNNGYLRTGEPRFGSPAGPGWDCYHQIEDLVTAAGTLTAHVGDADRWEFALEGFARPARLMDHPTGIRRRASCRGVAVPAGSLPLPGGSQLSMRDAQGHLVADLSGLRLFVEGRTDLRYITTAGRLLGEQQLLDSIEMTQAGGSGNLKKFWDVLTTDRGGTGRGRALLLFDYDSRMPLAEAGNITRRVLPLQTANPVKRGIENLFTRESLQRAIADKPAFVDIVSRHDAVIRGRHRVVPEKWSINDKEKRNLCDWMCEHGTADDFAGFGVVFDLIKDALIRA